MNPWDTARIHAAGRIAAGASLVAAPRLVGALWVGADARRPSSTVYSVALGIRDAALGAGLLSAVRGGGGTLPWIRAGMVADTADLIVTLRKRRDLPVLGVAAISAMAGGSVALGAWLHRGLD